MRWPWQRPAEPVTAYLALGANVGDRLAVLEAALADIAAADGVEVEAVSAVYETEPVGGVEQEPYLNAVVRVATTLAPRDLLRLAHGIEAAHGRDRAREVRWGPRTLDVDLLLYGDDVIDEPDLTVPHPRMTERAFVLVPLAEVLPAGVRLPDGTSVTSHITRLAPLDGIVPHVRLTTGPGSDADPLTHRPAGPGAPAAHLAPRHGGPERSGVHREAR